MSIVTKVPRDLFGISKHCVLGRSKIYWTMSFGIGGGASSPSLFGVLHSSQSHFGVSQPTRNLFRNLHSSTSLFPNVQSSSTCLLETYRLHQRVFSACPSSIRLVQRNQTITLFRKNLFRAIHALLTPLRSTG